MSITVNGPPSVAPTPPSDPAPPSGQTPVQRMIAAMFAYSNAMMGMTSVLGETSQKNVDLQSKFNEIMKKLSPTLPNGKPDPNYLDTSTKLSMDLSLAQERAKPTTSLMGQVSQAATTLLQDINTVTTAMGDLIRKIYG